jgi:hypothetical protein
MSPVKKMKNLAQQREKIRENVKKCCKQYLFFFILSHFPGSVAFFPGMVAPGLVAPGLVAPGLVAPASVGVPIVQCTYTIWRTYGHNSRHPSHGQLGPMVLPEGFFCGFSLK